MEKYLSFDNKISLERIINNEEDFYFLLSSTGKKYLLDFSESSVIFMEIQNTKLVTDYGIYYEEKKTLLNKLEIESNHILTLTNYKQMTIRIENIICDVVLIEPPIIKEIK